MSDGYAELDTMIESLRALPKSLEVAARDAASDLRDEVTRQINAGTSADGQAWQSRADGGRPLAGAEKSLFVAAIGTTIHFRLVGHVARHHLGRAKGGITRAILPTNSTLPPRYVKAISEALRRRVSATLGGARD